MNPYEVLDLDPNSDAATLTHALRAAVEEQPDPAKKQALAELWEEVTQNPAKRLEYALLAGPDYRACKPRDAAVAHSGHAAPKRTRRRKASDADERARS
jgi:hypothetical protein